MYISKLQLIQNVAARLLTGAKKFHHITPVLKSLHWLPVEKRIDFKMGRFLYILPCMIRLQNI